ncbi:MAG: NAD(P)-dependent oxidoreductase [Ignavibacteriaceae bacterium]|nr:NAD(P)-dependent oxidoreductase [Ignavibacteriaceae bacterium]
MENIVSKLSTEQYEKNFQELHPPLTYGSALAESSRCLYCYDSPCMKACPTHIDISEFIKKISTDNLLGSAKTILKSNWVALTCAKACPVAVLCEGACVLNEKGDKPIEIGRLQRYVIDNYFEQGMPALFDVKPSNGKSVAIIGSGPSGLACGAELALLGYNVTIFEQSDVPGGLNTWGIAPYKMRKQDALKEVELVKSFGVSVKTGTGIGKNITFNELYKNYDAVFLGIGLGESNALSVKGEELSGVISALDFIEQVKTEDWSSVPVGKKVAIIGAGNTSIDAATEAKRLGAEQVIVLYRRSSQDMSAYNFEFDLAKKDGIIFHFLTAPKNIIGKNSVEGIECIRMEPGQPDSKGKRSVLPVPGTEFTIPVDMVIKAIGQEAQNDFISSVPGVKFVNGKIEINVENYQTGNPKVFAGGDCINGGKEVVNAAYDGKMAAHGIDKFLCN